ncbi:glycosyltransferase [Aeromicrobium halocynthiae]|uniref:Glycosyltransferase n=1 Tax=Aeromicrobium halocynthiae TaxID=560557 RepID=A0ABN2VQG9_9ACTN
MSHRILLYSHDSVGLGHVTRNLEIAHALAGGLPELTGRPVTGLLVTGQASATERAMPVGWDWLVLPAVSRTGDGYAPRHLRTGLDELTSMRSGLIGAAIAELGPDLLVIDRHALGVERELEPALTRLRAQHPHCRVVLGLREVLDSPDVVAREWERIGGVGTVRRHVDEIWVYGDPQVHDPVATGEVPAGLAHLVRHTGYLSHGRHGGLLDGSSERPADPFLLTVLGGGSDGAELAQLAARAAVPAGHEHLLVTGPQMSQEDRVRVQACATPRTRVVEAVPDAARLVREAAAVVSMGGYNTVCELLATSTPSLVVPRVRRRHEQLIRARSLADRGLVDLLHPETATSHAISTWWSRVTGHHVERGDIDLDGLARVPRLAADTLVEESSHAI